jgi:hypothetical protein
VRATPSDADRKTRLFESLIGLRRVQKQVIGNDDLDFAIKVLEEELGEAVPQRTAAKAIGISSVEVAKLITAQKLATAESARGRTDVSLSSLVEFVEAKAREEAAVVPAATSSKDAPEEFKAGAMAKDVQQIMEMRALAFHRAIVRNLDQATIDEARERLVERREDGKISDELADEWEEVLAKNVDDVGAVMTEYSPRGKKLRESSPFDRRAS